MKIIIKIKTHPGTSQWLGLHFPNARGAGWIPGRGARIPHASQPKYQNIIQFSSVTQSCPTLCDCMNCSTQGLPVIINSRSSHKLICTESVMPSSHCILCCPILFLPPIPPSIRVFSNESTLRMRWPKYWSFSLSISPSNKPPGLVSFRMDCLDLLALQGTGKSVLQHHSSKASILQRLPFFTVQLSHPYMNTGKNHSLH